MLVILDFKVGNIDNSKFKKSMTSKKKLQNRFFSWDFLNNYLYLTNAYHFI